MPPWRTWAASCGSWGRWPAETRPLSGRNRDRHFAPNGSMARSSRRCSGILDHMSSPTRSSSGTRAARGDCAVVAVMRPRERQQLHSRERGTARTVHRRVIESGKDGFCRDSVTSRARHKAISELDAPVFVRRAEEPQTAHGKPVRLAPDEIHGEDRIRSRRGGERTQRVERGVTPHCRSGPVSS